MGRNERRSVFSVIMIVVGITVLLFPGSLPYPKFDSIPVNVTFWESTPIGTLLFTLTASDTAGNSNEMTINADDIDTLSYVTITQGNKTSPTTANITLNKELDRESNKGAKELRFSISYTGRENCMCCSNINTNKVNTSVLISILDVCDEPPQFDSPSYDLEIDEVNITQPVLVFSEIRATDRDLGIFSLFTYQMEPKTESDYWIYNETFKIDPTNGTVYLMKNLDYESNNVYQFTLLAQDTCNLTSKRANLTIKVKDVQDKPPFFIGLPYIKTIPEGNYSDSLILRVEALDGDLGIPNKVKYSFVNSITCSENNNVWCVFCMNIFAIHSLTGDITVTGNLDFEIMDALDIYGTCNFEVEADEITRHNVISSDDKRSKTSVTVTIQDENNHAPQFAKTFYDATVHENANTNTPILMDGGAIGIAIFDKDRGTNSKFSVTLECENDTACEVFAIVPTKPIFRDGLLTISVKNSSQLDYEKRQNITITVIAKEEKNSSHTDTATVVVKIENVNEFSPEFTNETYQARIEEGATRWKPVISITATDNDTDRYGKVTYNLSGGSNLFTVNNETGLVFTNCQPWQLDREHISQFYLTIIANDGGGRMNQAHLIISLDDVNDNPPVFQQEIYTAFLEENSTKYKNATFLTVKATDADQKGTKNSEISYSIGNTTWKSNFEINVTSGEIRLLSTLDYEALNNTLNGVIYFTVFAYDNGIPAKSGNVKVTIYVQDRNDNAPSFSMKNYCGTVKENANTGTFVGMVYATDADATEGNNKISFAIEAGGFDKFRINRTTGKITVHVGADFDTDDIKQYNLTIIAIDQGANSFTDTTAMSITIKDVNNKPPEFSQISYSVTPHENISVGSLLTSCTAKDPDENPSLSYSIISIVGWNESGENVNQSLLEFSIGIYETNGTLYVKNELDRETVSKMEIIIVVNDTGAEENKPQIAKATVTIMVLDVDDKPPRFKQGSDLRVGIRINMELDKAIFQLKGYVTDDDSPHNANNKWIFEKVLFQMTPDLAVKLSPEKKGPLCDDPICITRHGTVVNNMYYSEDMSGIFNFTVLVKDDAGNDMAFILIYLITDSQVLKMTLYRSLTEVSLIKDDILSDCSNVIGLLFVYENIKVHKLYDGRVDAFRTDLFFYIRDDKNNKVLSAEEAKRLLDEFADKLYYTRIRYSIISIESSLKSENTNNESTLTIYFMAALIALLTLVFLIEGYMFFSITNRYKTKLKAVLPSDTEVNTMKKDDFTVPGGNIDTHKENSLLDTPNAPTEYEKIDFKGQNSLDTNYADYTKISQSHELAERVITLAEVYYTEIRTEDPLEADIMDSNAQK